MPIWSSKRTLSGSFYIIDDGSKKIAKCKVCKQTISAKIERLKSHKSKCVVQTECVGIRNETALKSPSTSTKRKLDIYDDEPDTQGAVPGSPFPTPKRAKRQRNLSGYTVATDTPTWQKLDEQIAKLFYACNLPFNIADNPIWRQSVEMLRPGYYSPKRKDIGGYLLDKVHDKVTGNMKSMIQGKDAVLVQDGWSDIHNSPVIASSLHVDNKSYLFSATEAGSNKKIFIQCRACN